MAVNRDRKVTKTILAGVAILGVFLLAAQPSKAVDLTLQKAEARLYFSPDGGGASAIVDEVSRAQKEVLVQAYTLSLQSIAKALTEAHKRGVKVMLILDKSELMEGLTAAAILSKEGIPVYLDGKHALSRIHVMVIDNRKVITGSFNYSRASEEMNSEDLLVVQSADLAKAYRENWEKHRSHSERHQ